VPRRFFRRVSGVYRPKEHSWSWYLRPFRALLAHPTFFAVNRRSVAGAVWIGLLIGLLPLPGQTIAALLVAILLRVNLAIAGLTVWVTNPFTIVPVFYSEYRLGALILNEPLQPFTIELSWDWLTGGLLEVWKPLLLGSFISATVVASLGYVAVSVTWRGLVMMRYRSRHAAGR